MGSDGISVWLGAWSTEAEEDLGIGASKEGIQRGHQLVSAALHGDQYLRLLCDDRSRGVGSFRTGFMKFDRSCTVLSASHLSERQCVPLGTLTSCLTTANRSGCCPGGSCRQILVLAAVSELPVKWHATNMISQHFLTSCTMPASMSSSAVA
jgi:hypothetical protein